MQINDFKRFNHGITVLCNHCDYYDVYMIDIDEYRIELSDNFGMVIGTIDTDQLSKVEIINYDGNGDMIKLGDL